LPVTALAAHLAATLPPYMVPAFWRWIPALPLTGNGKVDRTALLALTDAAPAGAMADPQGAALNATERALAQVWSEVLAIPVTRRTDNFFTLGGHSLKAMRLVSLIAEQFDGEFAVGDVFQYPELGDQARRLSLRGAATTALVEAPSD